MENKRFCIIGAGVSGLSAAKNLLELGNVPFVLERTGDFGGTWVYTDNVGYDDQGLPVHTSMYKSLWTNLPKQVMTLPGHEYNPKLNSFLPAHEITKYIREYAEKFDLAKYIKFAHAAVNVKPRGDVWDVVYKNLKTGEEFSREFDAIIVANGHYSVPFIPKFKGFDKFTGNVLHSHDYRTNGSYRGKKTLIIGAGPSGLDLSLELGAVCKKVYFSHHLKSIPKMDYPGNLDHKPDIEEFGEDTVTFKDGSTCEIDSILLCTGYVYHYPFLDASCGITVDDNHVQGLYKQLINIEHPTMCIVGIPFWVAAIPMFDLQVRYFLALMQEKFKLPNKEELYAHTEAYYDGLAQRGVKKSHYHVLGPNQMDYYDSLAEEAKIKNLSLVLAKMHQDTGKMLFNDIKMMRRTNYFIIDDENFEKRPCED